MKDPELHLKYLFERISEGSISFTELLKETDKMDKNRILYIPYIKKYAQIIPALKQNSIQDYEHYLKKGVEQKIDQYIQQYTGKDYSKIKNQNSREPFLNLGVGRTVIIIESSITARYLKEKIRFRSKQNSNITILATNGYLKSALNSIETEKHVIAQLKSINRVTLSNENIRFINDILSRYNAEDLPTAFFLTYIKYKQPIFVENIIIATDQDSAGELIATEVIDNFDKTARERIRRLKIPVETFLYLSEKGIDEICIDHIIKNYSVDYIDTSLVRKRAWRKHELEKLRLEILTDLYRLTEKDGYIYFTNEEFKTIQQLSKLVESIRPDK